MFVVCGVFGMCRVLLSGGTSVAVAGVVMFVCVRLFPAQEFMLRIVDR